MSSRRLLFAVTAFVLVATAAAAQGHISIRRAAEAATGAENITMWLNWEDAGADPHTGDYTLGSTECVVSGGDNIIEDNGNAEIASGASNVGTYGAWTATGSPWGWYEHDPDESTVYDDCEGTVAFWWKGADVSPTSELIRLEGGSSSNMIRLYTVSGDYLRYRWRVSGSYQADCTAGTAILDDTWYFIELHYDCNTNEFSLEVNDSATGQGCDDDGSSMSVSAAPLDKMYIPFNETTGRQTFDNWMVSSEGDHDFWPNRNDTEKPSGACP